jgi:hypothetical protein
MRAEQGGRDMSRIEIWKGKPSWRALPGNKRMMICHDLATLVKHAFPDEGHENGGPYVVQSAESDLLIWTTEMDERVAAAQYASIRLGEYFEPLAYVTVTDKLDARVLATKLSVGKIQVLMRDG